MAKKNGMLTFSPDCSENLFVSFVKVLNFDKAYKKIETESGTILPKMPNLSAPN